MFGRQFLAKSYYNILIAGTDPDKQFEGSCTQVVVHFDLGGLLTA